MSSFQRGPEPQPTRSSSGGSGTSEPRRSRAPATVSGRSLLQLHVDQEGPAAAAILDRVIQRAEAAQDESTLSDIYGQLRERLASVVFRVIPLRFDDATGESYDLGVPREQAEAAMGRVRSALERLHNPRSSGEDSQPDGESDGDEAQWPPPANPPLPDGITLGPGMSWHQMARLANHYTLNGEQRRTLTRLMRHFLTVQANGIVWRIREIREGIQEEGFAGRNVEEDLTRIRNRAGEVRNQLEHCTSIPLMTGTYRGQLQRLDRRLGRVSGTQEREERFRQTAAPVLNPLHHARTKIREAAALYGASLGAGGIQGFTPNDGFDRLEEAMGSVQEAKRHYDADAGTLMIYRRQAGLTDAVQDVRQEAGSLAVISSGRVDAKATEIRDLARNFFHHGD